MADEQEQPQSATAGTQSTVEERVSKLEAELERVKQVCQDRGIIRFDE